MVCTRNRGDRLGASLASVLESMEEARLTTGVRCELVVVDNASTDTTGAVLRDLAAGEPRVRVVLAPEPGLSRARNHGVRSATGAYLLFTDDDIIVPREWVSRMTAPMRAGLADLVNGGVRLAPDLHRAWMTPALTAAYYAGVPDPPVIGQEFAGANMGATRAVVDGTAFDEMLGTVRYPGADDILFRAHAVAAGARLHGAANATVEHHFDPGRLSPTRLENQAEGYGRCDAYVFYHWLLVPARAERLKVVAHRAELLARRVMARGDRYDERLVRARRELAFHREMVALRKAPRRPGAPAR